MDEEKTSAELLKEARENMEATLEILKQLNREFGNADDEA